MKIVFLGTNGWYDTETGNTICTLLDAKSYYIILDAGNGIHKADRYIKENKPVYLFLSHFHLDHIEGLHILTKFKFRSLTIFGQPGTKRILRNFLSDKYSVPLHKLPYPTKATDINEGWHNTPFKFQCLRLEHVTSCFGYRFELDNKILSYCTDTGYCDNVVELSRNSDLLISECAYASAQENPAWPHLNPKLAAKIVLRSNTKKLALTHFDAEVYKTMAQRTVAEKNAQKSFKNTFAAKDDMAIRI